MPKVQTWKLCDPFHICSLCTQTHIHKRLIYTFFSETKLEIFKGKLSEFVMQEPNENRIMGAQALLLFLSGGHPGENGAKHGTNLQLQKETTASLSYNTSLFCGLSRCNTNAHSCKRKLVLSLELCSFFSFTPRGPD